MSNQNTNNNQKKKKDLPSTMSLNCNIGGFSEFSNPIKGDKSLAITIFHNKKTKEGQKPTIFTMFLNEKQYEITDYSQKDGKTLIDSIKLNRTGEEFKKGDWTHIDNANFTAKLKRVKGEEKMNLMFSRPKVFSLNQKGNIIDKESYSSSGFINFLNKTEKGVISTIETNGIKTKLFVPNDQIKNIETSEKNGKQIITGIDTVFDNKKFEIGDVLSITSKNIPEISTNSFTNNQDMKKVEINAMVFGNPKNVSLKVVYKNPRNKKISQESIQQNQQINIDNVPNF